MQPEWTGKRGRATCSLFSNIYKLFYALVVYFCRCPCVGRWYDVFYDCIIIIIIRLDWRAGAEALDAIVQAQNYERHSWACGKLQVPERANNWYKYFCGVFNDQAFVFLFEYFTLLLDLSAGNMNKLMISALPNKPTTMGVAHLAVNVLKCFTIHTCSRLWVWALVHIPSKVFIGITSIYLPVRTNEEKEQATRR